jgi:NTP pyrophosphatase (non-canonical NTP hydrolase)
MDKIKLDGHHPLVDGVIRRNITTYYESRKLKVPDDQEALLYLVSEIGELADAFVDSKSDDWVRNNSKYRSISDEVADVLMMLYVFSMQRNLNPYNCLVDKMKRKIEELK